MDASQGENRFRVEAPPGAFVTPKTEKSSSWFYWVLNLLALVFSGASIYLAASSQWNLIKGVFR